MKFLHIFNIFKTYSYSPIWCIWLSFMEQAGFELVAGTECCTQAIKLHITFYFHNTVFMSPQSDEGDTFYIENCLKEPHFNMFPALVSDTCPTERGYLMEHWITYKITIAPCFALCARTKLAKPIVWFRINTPITVFLVEVRCVPQTRRYGEVINTNRLGE